MIRNTQGHIVSKTAQAVVDTRDVFSNIDLYDRIRENDEFIKINGQYWWLTTVQNAVSLGYNCHVFEDGKILNSFIIARRQ